MARDLLTLRPQASVAGDVPANQDSGEAHAVTSPEPEERPATNPKYRPGFNLPDRLNTLDDTRRQFIGCKERKQFDWDELHTAIVGPTIPIITSEAANMLGNHAARIATGVVAVGISRATGRPVITGWNIVPVEGQRCRPGRWSATCRPSSPAWWASVHSMPSSAG